MRLKPVLMLPVSSLHGMLSVGYVIMIAGANEISQSSVGFVYFCAIFPTLLVKLTGPYWCASSSGDVRKVLQPSDAKQSLLDHKHRTLQHVIFVQIDGMCYILPSTPYHHKSHQHPGSPGTIVSDGVQVSPRTLWRAHVGLCSAHVSCVHNGGPFARRGLAVAGRGLLGTTRRPWRGLLPGHVHVF